MTPPIRMVSVPEDVATEAVNCMARAYERVHSLPRVPDTELANRIGAAKEALRIALRAAPVREEGGAVLQAFADEVARIAITDDTSGDDAFNALNVVVDYARELSKARPDPDDTSGDLHGRLFRNPALATREEAPAEAGEIGAEYDAAAHCVTLAECPPGLFLFNGALGFKSQYGAMEPLGSNPTRNEWKVGSRADAYCADSGEYFWGGTWNHDDRAKLLVYPIDADVVAMVASHGPSALRAQPQAREEAQPVADAVEPIELAIAALKGHISAIQVAKRGGGSSSLITDCINSLPEIVRWVEGGLFNVEAAFEQYEATPPAPEAEKLRASDGDVWSAAGCPEETFTDAAAAFAAAIEWIEEGQKERPERLHRTRNLPDVWAIMLNGEMSLFDTEAEALAALQAEQGAK